MGATVTLYLQLAAAALGVVYNCMLTYEAWVNGLWRKVAFSTLTVALLVYATYSIAMKLA